MLLFYLSSFDTLEEKNKFEELYNHYNKLMKYVAMEILKDEYLAEDAVHNAFLRIIDNFNCIEDINSLRTKHFVIIITKNIAKDIYVKRKREKVVENVEFDFPFTAIEEVSLKNIEFERVVKAIHNLPELYRDVLILKYLYEYENNEIARLLSIKKETVRKRLERGRLKLFQLIERVDD